LSYDYEFRQRHFPYYSEAIPITLVGTSFISFLLPGVIVGGVVVAALALGAELLLRRVGQRSLLMAALVGILALDLLRIGGFYRELLTFGGSAFGVLVITRAGWRADGAPPTDLDGRNLRHVNSN
jgi:hypothetical protein